MAKIMTAAQFRKCPPGTLFAYGERWCFSPMLILREHIDGPGYWGFWATDPMWVDAEESTEDTDRMGEMLSSGASFPADTSCSKYMSYDSGKMDVFFVLESADWDGICKDAVFES